MRNTSNSFERQIPIPLTVLGGHKGAGKTSVIRHLLEAQGRGKVVAIIRQPTAVNGNGHHELECPDDLVPGKNKGTWITSHDPTDALMDLASSATRPDHVIVETEGAESLRRTGGFAYMPGYRPDGFVLVVDAGVAARADLADAISVEEREQLRAAHLIVLNKLDIVGQRAAAATQRALRKLAPLARFLWCENGRVAPPLLLGATSGAQVSEDWGVVAQWRADFLPVASRTEKARFGEHCRSWCLVADHSVEAREFRSWVARLPETVLRGAGVVQLAEEPQHQYEFEMIGARWRLVRRGPWGTTPPVTRLNVVSLGGASSRARSTTRSESIAE
jgi:G3E family GTPase